MTSINTCINSYRLIEELGSGTFGIVYKVQHTILSNRIYALKLMRTASLPNAVDRDRFLKEAIVLEMVKHPHILSVIDAGMYEGLPYIVTEYAAHGSLLHRLKRQQGKLLATDEASTILLQIGQALHHAHQQKFVHRDLKPENILFNAKDDVLLADFGIAKMLETVGIRQGTIIGTPSYMAPEQFHGEASRESDQYALGCIAYELLTGRQPFHAPDMASMMFKHIMEQPVPPRQLNANLPLPIEQAILKAMAKDPKDRFLSILAFAQMFQQAVQPLHQPKLAPSPIPPLSAQVPLTSSGSGWICQKCGYQNRPGAKFCPLDGQPLISSGVSAPTIPANLPAPVPVKTIPSAPAPQPVMAATVRALLHPVAGIRLYTYRGPYGAVRSLSWVSNNCYVAVGDAEGKIEVWDVASKRLRASFHGHMHEVKALLWSPDGTHIASYAHQEKEIHVWDGATGQNVTSYRDHTSDVSAAAWSPDGALIASGEENAGPTTVHAWNTANGQQIALCTTSFPGARKAIAWARDNHRIAITSHTRRRNKPHCIARIYVWDIVAESSILAYDRDTQMGKAIPNQHEIFATTWSPDGNHLAFLEDYMPYQRLSQHLSEMILDPSKRSVIHKRCYSYDPNESNSISPYGDLHAYFLSVPGGWSPDGAYIATGIEKAVPVWSTTTGEDMFVYQGHSSPVTQVVWSPDGRSIASASDTTVHVWDSKGKNTIFYCDHASHVEEVGWSPTSDRIASTSSESIIRVTETATGITRSEVVAYRGYSEDAPSLAWSPSGKYIAFWNNEAAVSIWDTATEDILCVYRKHTHPVKSIEWSSDEKYIASSADREETRIWNVFTGDDITTPQGDMKAWVPGSESIVIYNRGGNTSLKIWNIATGNEVVPSGAYFEDVQHIACSPDGTYIASCGHGDFNGWVRVWDTHRGSIKKRPRSSGLASPVAWSPDSKYIAYIAPGDQGRVMIRVWEPSSGGSMTTFSAQSESVDIDILTWSPDGTKIASTDRKGRVHIWDVATGNIITSYQGHSSHLTSLIWSPDGSHIASTVEKGTHIWDAKNGSRIHTHIGSWNWSPDGMYTATSFKELVVQVWQT